VKQVDLSGKPFHFIGIGGIGMSALAHILVDRRLPVSGSDLRSTHITDRLQNMGAKIFTSQSADNLGIYRQENGNLPQIICSTAIGGDNAEYQAALDLNCPIFHRSDLLAALIQDYYSIAVAGTHGKTTTSSLISYVLFQADCDPTIIVGGEVDAWEGNARSGAGKYLVAEADESDGSLVKHHPKIGIITNIELDHPDHYTDLEQVIATFQTFANQCEILIGCIDDSIVRTRFQPQITYSLNPDSKADYIAKNIQYAADGSSAEVWERGKLLGKVSLKLMGEHNISNALATIAASRSIGLDFETIAAAISTFSGTKRRFEIKGKANNITFVDDYAHHHTEIAATLAAARQKVSQSEEFERVVAIFQPHRYSRTQEFLSQQGQCFCDADLVVITDIYSAGEANPNNLSGADLVTEIEKNHSQVFYHADLNTIADFLKNVLKQGDLAMFLGAGNLNQSIPKLIGSYNP
jgi:UDP-N-acetylmuramate--alanine ligase